MTTSRNVPPATSVSADDHATKARELAESVVNKVQAFTDSIGEIPNRNACEQGLAKLLEPALRAAAEAERAVILRVLEDDRDGSPNMLAIGLMRAIELIRARGGAR
jgi:hypothetical protein